MAALVAYAGPWQSWSGLTHEGELLLVERQDASGLRIRIQQAGSQVSTRCDSVVAPSREGLARHLQAAGIRAAQGQEATLVDTTAAHLSDPATCRLNLAIRNEWVVATIVADQRDPAVATLTIDQATALGEWLDPI